MGFCLSLFALDFARRACPRFRENDVIGLWIPAFAGMTGGELGMTGGDRKSRAENKALAISQGNGERLSLIPLVGRGDQRAAAPVYTTALFVVPAGAED